MKKFAAMVLALVMCLGMASCGDSGSESKDKEDTSSVSAKSDSEKPAETSAADSADNAGTEATEPAEPEVEVQSVEAANELLGIKCSFDVPKFEGWEQEKYEEDGDQTRVKLKYSFTADDGSNSYCTIDVYLLVDSTNGLDWFMEKNENIPNTEYMGYINGHTRSQDCPMYFYGEDYLDGKVRVDVNVSCMDENMPQDKYEEMLTTIQKSLRTEVLDTNKIYDSDGNLLTVDGKLKIPPVVEIAGTKAEVHFATYNRTIDAQTEFTADGNNVEMHESGLVRSDIFDKFIESYAKDQPYDCEVNGHAAKGRLWNDFGTLTAEYIVQFDDETFYRFYVSSKGSLDLAAINEMMNGAERGTLEAQLNGYLSDFVSSIETL